MPLTPQSKWPQRFGSRLTLTASCHPPSHTMMRHEHLPDINTWFFGVQSSPAGLITPWLLINPDTAH
jgi:hypothetical protein